MIGSIYMIYSKNKNIKDFYIGSTTEKVSTRFSKHKYRCEDLKYRYYNYPLYMFIRNNGGFEEWTYKVIEEVECKNKRHLQEIERYYIEDMGATLNGSIPTREHK